MFANVNKSTLKSTHGTILCGVAQGLHISLDFRAYLQNDLKPRKLCEYLKLRGLANQNLCAVGRLRSALASVCKQNRSTGKLKLHSNIMLGAKFLFLENRSKYSPHTYMVIFLVSIQTVNILLVFCKSLSFDVFQFS